MFNFKRDYKYQIFKFFEAFKSRDSWYKRFKFKAYFYLQITNFNRSGFRISNVKRSGFKTSDFKYASEQLQTRVLQSLIFRNVKFLISKSWITRFKHQSVEFQSHWFQDTECKNIQISRFPILNTRTTNFECKYHKFRTLRDLKFSIWKS